MLNNTYRFLSNNAGIFFFFREGFAHFMKVIQLQKVSMYCLCTTFSEIQFQIITIILFSFYTFPKLAFFWKQGFCVGNWRDVMHI